MKNIQYGNKLCVNGIISISEIRANVQNFVKVEVLSLRCLLITGWTVHAQWVLYLITLRKNKLGTVCEFVFIFVVNLYI